MAPLYILREFPPPHHFQGSPLGLTGYVANENNRVSIFSLTNEPIINDAYIRLVNDDLYDAPVCDPDEIGFRIVDDIRATVASLKFNQKPQINFTPQIPEDIIGMLCTYKISTT